MELRLIYINNIVISDDNHFPVIWGKGFCNINNLIYYDNIIKVKTKKYDIYHGGEFINIG